MKTDQTPGIPKSFKEVGDKNKWVTSFKNRWSNRSI